MRSVVIVFPGSNRERDMAYALKTITGRPPAMVWYTNTSLPPADLIVLPGGFSYGDYLRAGAIAARAPVIAAVGERARAGVPVLGICNGFQILCEAGLLPGALMRNASLKFICREVHLRVETPESPFTRAYPKRAIIRCPIAHGDGNYRCGDETLAILRGEDRIAFRYVDAAGNPSKEANPNGSVDNIAGILDPRRRVLGMMPHPENLIEPLQGCRDGRPLFEGVAQCLEAVA
ncbi:phosphoribosylformylglycinamidine synthase subunit PurQ [Bauldia sp.]|uniref:phosphoribosylformylglycinamidine synthase subunit PurQ n=1 Tax=Bauldia sp. TaxID=2575872 RepID=UPI003BA9EB24